LLVKGCMIMYFFAYSLESVRYEGVIVGVRDHDPSRLGRLSTRHGVLSARSARCIETA